MLTLRPASAAAIALGLVGLGALLSSSLRRPCPRLPRPAAQPALQSTAAQQQLLMQQQQQLLLLLQQQQAKAQQPQQPGQRQLLEPSAPPPELTSSQLTPPPPPVPTQRPPLPELPGPGHADEWAADPPDKFHPVVTGNQPLGNMLTRYFWACALALLANSSLDGRTVCPGESFLPIPRGRTRVFKGRVSPTGRMRPKNFGRCSPVLKHLPADGSEHVRPSGSPTDMRKAMLAAMSHLPLPLHDKRNWWARNGTLLRGGFPFWGWTWEDDPLGLLWAVRPLHRELMRRFLPRRTCVADVVIHLRCADVPFCRTQYTLMRNDWFRTALMAVQLPPNAQVCVLLCSTHDTVGCDDREPTTVRTKFRDHVRRAARSGTCAAVGEEVVRAVSSVPNVGNVTLLCGGDGEGVERDFAAMVHAPVLVSTGSSLSFHAALAQAEGHVAVLPRPPMRGRFTRRMRAFGTAYPPAGSGILHLAAPRLRHREVFDYYNTTDVVRLLRTPGPPCDGCMLSERDEDAPS
eukprot:TRINITY_DN18473_c0_g1_i2.p1 TRINITY_DN18473_c0_g1~~TRINITY_DN18473_c0_g1_i2.p1  ORF type:complete len:517 (+),score=121.94 TRINITY_DN18473_c0_g1_i2:78-1628(+)